MGSVRLSPKQEEFALEFMLNGKNATEAYKKVYDSKTDNERTIWRSAFDVKNNRKVATRIHELEMAQFESNILTLEERKKILSKQGKEGNYKAIDLLNKMDGVYIEKQEINMNGHITMLPPKNKDK